MKKDKKIVTKNKKNSEWPKTFVLIATLFVTALFHTIRQIWIGAKNRTLPAHWFLCWVVPVGLILFFRLDQKLMGLTQYSNWYPIRPGFYWPYAFTFLYTPYILWGAVRAGQYQKFRHAMSIALHEAGLITSLGRMPSIISDISLDEAVREATFATNGITLTDFKEAKERLCEVFGSIVDIKQVSTGIIAIQYSHSELPKNTEIFDVPSASDPGTFSIGYTRSGLITVKLRDVPHLLIAGKTGSGKSTFVRQFIATLLAYNPTMEIYYIDLKHLLEAGPFKNAKRLIAIGQVPGAITLLRRMEEIIKERAEFLLLNDCTSIEELTDIKTPLKWTKEVPSQGYITRTMVVIDEASELFLGGGAATLAQAKDAKRLAIGIAAKGRAVGVHLVVSTQRPDAKAVDMQLKTNLVGRLCFYMADNASSMTILDSVRAAHLPADTPGRAIWRAGGEQKEVQALYLSKASLTHVLITRDLIKDEADVEMSTTSSTQTNESTDKSNNSQMNTSTAETIDANHNRVTG